MTQTIEKPQKLPASDAYLEVAYAHIAEHFADPDLNLGAIAAKAGRSPFHLHRSFHRHYGVTPKALADNLRMDKAIDLMRAKSHSLSEIAKACGYCHLSAFISRFKQLMGTTPGQWMKGNR